MGYLSLVGSFSPNICRDKPIAFQCQSFPAKLESFAVSPAVEKSSEQFSELPLADAPKKAISAISVSQNASRLTTRQL
jgi:hypothetical protein